MLRSLSARPLLLLAGLVLAAACGDDDPATDRPGGEGSTRATVGVAGGAVELPGGGNLLIPAGALGADTEISVSSVAAPAGEEFSAAGPYYRFEPEGLVFAEPVRVSLPVQGAVPAGSVLGIAWRSAGRPWGRLGDEAVDDGPPRTVSAHVLHFSEGGAALWTGLEPVCCVSTDADERLEESYWEECQGRDGWAVRFDGGCGQVCCATGRGDELDVRLRPYGECVADPDGWEARDPGWCAPNCCTLQGAQGPVGVIVADFECVLRQGEPGTGEDDCAPVCCVSDGPEEELEESHWGECQGREGWAVRSDGGCGEVCCLTGDEDGPHARLRPYDECAGDPGWLAARDAHWCDPGCCILQGERGSVGAVMADFECVARQGEPGRAEEECARVCCVSADVEQNVEERLRAECQAEDGWRVGSEGACGDVCCLAGAGETLEAAVRTYAACEQQAERGGARDVAWCEPTCCLLPGEGEERRGLTRFECAAVQGEERPDSAECDTVCCEWHDGGEWDETARAECAARDDWFVAREGGCGEVCCLQRQGDEPVATVVPYAACAAAEMRWGVRAPAACESVCCRLAGPPETLAFRAAFVCEALQGTEAPADDCPAICCRGPAATEWIPNENECLGIPGEIAPPGECGADECAGTTPLPGNEGTLVGTLARHTDTSGAGLPCDDQEPSDEQKTAGPDAAWRVDIPGGTCLRAKAGLTGFNPALYVLDGCEPSECLAYTYDRPRGQQIVPHTYPLPRPGEQRTTAVEVCTRRDEPRSVVLWLDSGVGQAGAAPAQGDGAFRLDWSLSPSLPPNDGQAQRRVVVVGAGVPIDGTRGATDQFQAQGCPGLPQGAGAGSADLWYGLDDLAAGRYVVGWRILTGGAEQLAEGTHMVAALDDAGHCLAALQGGREALLRLDVAEGAALTLALDFGNLPRSTLYEVVAQRYDGPANDACADALEIPGLPFEVEGSTVGALDDLRTEGPACGDLLADEQGRGLPDAVYRYVPPANETVTFTIEALDPGFAPALVVAPACGPDTVTCLDGLQLDGETPSASQSVRLTGGVPVWLVVDGGDPTTGRPAGRYRLGVQAGGAPGPDDCAHALEVPELPVRLRLTGRGLSNSFSAQGTSCSDYLCCRRESRYAITTSCDGIAVDDWTPCTPTCCGAGDGASEELLGNCLHDGGDPSCAGVALPVSCCQILQVPEIGYVLAAGCGDPLNGGVQGTIVDAAYCEPVCCVGHGHTKRGNCENLEARSLPFPPCGRGCGGATAEQGEGGAETLDLVLRHTAAEDGVLEARVVHIDAQGFRLYGFVDACVEGPGRSDCDGSNPVWNRTLLPLRAGQTAFVVVDGFDPERPFAPAEVELRWHPGLPDNPTCATARTIGPAPASVHGTLAEAGNDVAGVSSPACPRIDGALQGTDVVFRLDPGPAPADWIVGLLSGDFDPYLVALSECTEGLPFRDECLAVAGGPLEGLPHLVLEGLSEPVYVVVDSPGGQPWGSYDLEAMPLAPLPNETCADATPIGALPARVVGTTYGASDDLRMPAGLGAEGMVGPGPDVVYSLVITEEMAALPHGVTVELTGWTYRFRLYLLRNGCAPDGSTFLDDPATKMTLAGRNLVAGDTIYIVLDGASDDAVGMFALEVRAAQPWEAP